jgi:hypothetical protein
MSGFTVAGTFFKAQAHLLEFNVAVEMHDSCQDKCQDFVPFGKLSLLSPHIAIKIASELQH